MLFTLLTLIIHNTKLYLHCSYKRYQITINNCPSLSCITYFSVGTMLLNSNKLWGCKPCCVTDEHKTVLYTKLMCCCGHATFFVSWYTKRQRNCGGETDSVLTRRSLNWVCCTCLMYCWEQLLCVAGDTYKLQYVALVQRRHKNYTSMRRTSAHDGVCAVSDDSLA